MGDNAKTPEVIDLTQSPPNGSTPLTAFNIIEVEMGSPTFGLSGDASKWPGKPCWKSARVTEEPNNLSKRVSPELASETRSTQRTCNQGEDDTFDTRVSRDGHTKAPILDPRLRSPSPPDGAQPFYVDLQPDILPAASFSTPSTSTKDIAKDLLVPSHVTFHDATAVEILVSPGDGDDEDYIDYLDFDDAKETVRYFDSVQEDAVKLSRTVCKNCSAEGDHKTSSCPMIICLTCGAHNEHTTRSCPISKTCFICGMKGHIIANCPNRRRAVSRYPDEGCERCASHLHKTNECPTWWRLYEYVTDGEKSSILSARQAKKDLKLGQGGEGFIADDEWCYNCGQSGHWGDDCNDMQPVGLRDHSAFSAHNIMSGPFYDPQVVYKSSTVRRTSQWQGEGEELQCWAGRLPGHVGREGRKKSMALLAKKVEEREAEDDPDDWFGRARKGVRVVKESKSNTEKIKFAKRQGGEQRSQISPSEPKLLDRLRDKHRPYVPWTRDRSAHRDQPLLKSASKGGDRHRPKRGSSPKDNGDNCRRDYSRNDNRGSRYHGGYSR